MRSLIRLLAVLIVFAGMAHAATWYVRPDGGTRFSTNVTSGQCDGLGDAAYPGTGTNQHCAFNDFRLTFQDGSFNDGSTFPGWGWVIAGGDTVIVRGSISTGVSYRVGWPQSTTCLTMSGTQCFGIPGNAQNSGSPPVPSGTSGAHTKILGENFGSCSSATAKTQLNGGFGTGTVLGLVGSSYVDVACLDITDHSSCTKGGTGNGCQTFSPFDDYASNAFEMNNTTTNVTLTDMSIHGLASNGGLGSTGDGVVLTNVLMSGNPSSCWNMDDGSGTTGTGTLTWNGVHLLFCGLAETYPIASTITVPIAGNQTATVGVVNFGTDDTTGGYGDCIGTATEVSSPAWTMNVTKSTAAYCTQDGFDLLHLQGGGTTLNISDSLAYSNMGQQLKMGAAGTAVNNILVGNCNAMRQAIPGLPSGYNTNLHDFCRASDVAVFMSVNDDATTKFQFNTEYSANTIDLAMAANSSCTTSTCVLIVQNNIFVNFLNNTADGYPDGGTGDYPTPIFFDDGSEPFVNPGSIYAYNDTFHWKSSWTCPFTSYFETNALCGDPGLTDESWHLYGLGNVAPASGASAVVGAGTPISGVTTDYANNLRPNPPSMGALEFVTSGSGGVIFSGNVRMSGNVILQ